MLLIGSATGDSPDRDGQTAANISYVLRPRSRPSLFLRRSVWYLANSSSSYGSAQSRTSSTLPSSVTLVETITFLIVASFGASLIPGGSTPVTPRPVSPRGHARLRGLGGEPGRHARGWTTELASLRVAVSAGVVRGGASFSRETSAKRRTRT